MKRGWLAGFAILAMLAVVHTALALGEGSDWFQINNRLRVEYDDNVFLTEDDEQDSFKLIEEVELFLNMNLDQTFVSLRYRPSYVYWTDRDPDDNDFNHDIDFVLSHNFTPRLSLNLKDTFRIAELPELIDRGTVFRENNDFVYNAADGTLAYLLNPKTRLEAAGRYNILRYDENDVAEREDYDLYVAGLNLRHQMVPETALLGELRYEVADYKNNERGSDGYQAGGALEQTFSPNLLGNLRLGYQYKEFDDAKVDDTDSPYVDASLTILPSPATRLSVGGGYAMYETDVFPYTNQDQFKAYLSLAHDLTARLALYLSTTYIMSAYDAEESLSDEVAGDGDEDIFQLSAKVAYRLNRSNTLEANWQFIDLGSDVREEYTRNRVGLGWKVEL